MSAPDPGRMERARWLGALSVDGGAVERLLDAVGGVVQFLPAQRDQLRGALAKVLADSPTFERARQKDIESACAAPECPFPRESNGYCRRHARQLNRAGHFKRKEKQRRQYVRHITVRYTEEQEQKLARACIGGKSAVALLREFIDSLP